MSHVFRRALGIAMPFLALATAYWAVAFLIQRSVLFPAPLGGNRPTTLEAAEVVSLRQRAGTVHVLLLLPTVRTTGPAPLLIFTHGNGELAQGWIADFAVPRKWGWAALLVEYPGYGGEPGRPSEDTINAVVGAAYQWAWRDTRIDRRRIVAYGRSIGGGPAAHLASTQQVAALILEASFTSVPRLARRFLLPAFLVRDRFDNLAALQSYRGPLLVLHGRSDAVVPVSEGKALAAAVRAAEFVELSCGHNDCARPWAAIGKFLAAKGVMP
jgi:uncharacterized protein